MFSASDDFGETGRFEARFAVTPMGRAFRDDSGEVRALSAAEAEAALGEGRALIKKAASQHNLINFFLIAAIVAAALLFDHRPDAPFSPGAIVGAGAFAGHLLAAWIFHQQVRRASAIPSEKFANRIALSPTLIAPMIRRNWFRTLRGALATGAILYILWITFTITGNPDPHSLGGGSFGLDGTTGQTAGKSGDANMVAFAQHMPQIGAVIALAWIALGLEKWLDRDIARDTARMEAGAAPLRNL